MATHILVVEDEPSIADAVEFVLQQDGHVVHSARTLAEARRQWVEADLVVLDVGLPDGNGFDFCREIRRSSQVPLLFLTARAEEIDRVVGLELGGDDYVTKPFSPRELAARVRGILRRSFAQPSAVESSAEGVRNGASLASGGESERGIRMSASRGAAGESKEQTLKKSDFENTPLICHGDLFVDMDRACAVLGSEPLDLTRQELLLLHHLARFPGRVHSRSQLMQAVWEVPDSALERTVDAHIKTLRAKMRGAGSEKEWIQTHRGFGYSLAVS
jgi:two-component system catabolic regulation response regulator CreB